MIYSAWGIDGFDNILIAGMQLPAHDRLEPNIQFIKAFEAPSWNHAMQQYHEWQGWEPYKPMLDTDGTPYPEETSPNSDAESTD